LALPLIGIGVCAHWGGLRFTVYAVPIAEMSAYISLVKLLADYFSYSLLEFGKISHSLFSQHNHPYSFI